MGLTHPDILKAERFGGEWNYGADGRGAEFVGICAFCEECLYDDDTYAEDKHGNVFCNFDEAVDFHGIKEVGM